MDDEEIRLTVRQAIQEAAKSSRSHRRTRQYFHASPKRFKVGQILTGGHNGGYWTSEGGDPDDPQMVLCLTTDPVPHCTILKNALRDNWFVYEVEPLQDIDDQRPNGNYEVQCHSARVIRIVGSARGLTRNRRHGSVVKGRRESVHSKLGWRLGRF